MSGITNVNTRTIPLNIGTPGTGVSTKQFDKNELVQRIQKARDTAFMNYGYIQPIPYNLPGSDWDINYSADCNYLAVACSVSPFVRIYYRREGRYEQLSNPSILPTDWAFGVSFSPNGTYLAVSHQTSRFLTIYKRSGNTFTKLADPATLPAQVSRRAAWSPDSVYLAVPHTWSPYVTIYKRSGDTFTKLANPSLLPTGNAFGAAFSSDGVYLTIAHDTSPFVTIYKRSGDTFTKLANPSVLPGGNGRNVAIDPTNTYMAVANISTTDNLKIYKRSGDVFTAVNPQPVQSNNNGKSVSFSPNGNYLGFGTRGTGFLRILRRVNDQFLDVNSVGLTNTIAYGIHFNSEGRLGVSTASVGTQSMNEFENDGGDNYISVLNLCHALAPTGAVLGRFAAISRKAKYIAVARETGDPRISIAKKEKHWYLPLNEIYSLPGQIKHILFSDDARYLFVSRSSSYVDSVKVYERNETTDWYEPSSKLPNYPAATWTWGTALHPNGKYLAISHWSAPKVSIFDITTNPFTQITSSFTAPASPYGIPAFSSCGNYLVTTSTVAPFLRVYSFNEGVLADMPGPTTMPPSAAYDCWFSPNNNFFITSLGASPWIVLYSFSNGVLTYIGETDRDVPGAMVNSLYFSLDSSRFFVAYHQNLQTYAFSNGSYMGINTPITEQRTYASTNFIAGSPDGFCITQPGWNGDVFALLAPTGPTIQMLSPLRNKADAINDGRFPVQNVGYVQEETAYGQTVNFKSLQEWQV